MNAETSAVGRMLGMMGIAAKKSIASRDEIANRQGENEPAQTAKPFVALMETISKAVTEKDLEAAAAVIKSSKPPAPCNEAKEMFKYPKSALPKIAKEMITAREMKAPCQAILRLRFSLSLAVKARNIGVAPGGSRITNRVTKA
jgi:hypothetical protein